MTHDTDREERGRKRERERARATIQTHRLVEWRPLHLEDLIAVTNKGVQRCLHVAHVPQHHHLMGRTRAQEYQNKSEAHVRHKDTSRTHL